MDPWVASIDQSIVPIKGGRDENPTRARGPRSRPSPARRTFRGEILAWRRFSVITVRPLLYH